jgi:hypothetical protein
MRTNLSNKLGSLAILGLGVCWGCGTSSEGGDHSGGATSPSGGSDSSVSAGTGGGPAGSGGASTTVPTDSGGVTSSGGEPGSGGVTNSGGSPGSGGTTAATGGSAAGGSATGGASVGTGGRGRGGASPGTGGRGTGTGGAGTTGGTGTGGAGTGGTEAGGEGTGGASAAGGSTATGDNCAIGAWAAADPSAAGPFAVTTENEVGPEAGEAEDDGTIPRFTLFRPEDMTQSGVCHPLITWGNGTGSTPSMYGSLLRHFASHGFVVIGSNSTNVSRGDPKPMNVGVTWVLEQNEDPSSVLYHHIDTTHIGATGHSQGAMATSQACGDEHITTCLPIEGAQVQRNLHGPAMFFCGGQDTLVGCSGAQSALAAVTDLPAMYANYLTVDHGSWLSFGNKRSDVETAITAWMRVHLMADESLRSWFYGASCKLCTDSAWEIDRKNMDE